MKRGNEQDTQSAPPTIVKDAIDALFVNKDVHVYRKECLVGPLDFFRTSAARITAHCMNIEASHADEFAEYLKSLDISGSEILTKIHIPTLTALINSAPEHNTVFYDLFVWLWTIDGIIDGEGNRNDKFALIDAIEKAFDGDVSDHITAKMAHKNLVAFQKFAPDLVPLWIEYGKRYLNGMRRKISHDPVDQSLLTLQQFEDIRYGDSGVAMVLLYSAFATNTPLTLEQSKSLESLIHSTSMHIAHMNDVFARKIQEERMFNIVNIAKSKLLSFSVSDATAVQLVWEHCHQYIRGILAFSPKTPHEILLQEHCKKWVVANILWSTMSPRYSSKLWKSIL